MKEPQGFVGAVDYIESVIQEEGFFLLAFATPSSIEGMYQFTIRHNLPQGSIPSFVFNIMGHLFNSPQSSSAGFDEGEPEGTTNAPI